MRIGILGPLEVHAGGRQVEVGGARLRALLILLAVEAGRVVSVERLIGDLWEDRPPAGAPNALQSLVSRLRAALGDGREVIESHPAGYRLAVGRGDVDAHDFEARVELARRAVDPAAAAAGLRAALALWRGPALADVRGTPFADGPVARLEGLRRAATEERVEADLVLGRQAELIPELEALTAADPLREPLRGQLMRALYAAGRQADALAVFTETRRALAETLGVDPSPELERVHLAVLRRDPELLPTAGSMDRPGPEPRSNTNIRAGLTSFIGRDDELKRVTKLLGEGRLVTLTGPGGAGKTRLSTEAAARLADRMPDGVWFVELAPISDPAEVPQAVLSVLGLREVTLLTKARTPGSVPEVADPVDRLAEALTGKRMLLLLDNCEHLVDAAARLADRLLADAPGVRILTTSREPLGITGETLWPVDPLGLPPEDAGADAATTYPAVRLFADRAVAVRPGFAVTHDNAADIVRICRALDGMPLAIELAAARMRALTPEQVAARLDDRFRLLTAGSRTALPRHQTLRAVVEWSWDLLDDAERALWRRLSIFAGGATVASAEAICAGGGVAEGDVLDVLTALVDKSLVVIVGDGEPRYRMLETIRAYGLERLAEAGEEERVRRAHAAYFLGLAETAEPQLRRRDQMRWLGRLAAEHDNLHAAVHWAISAGDARSAARFCAALGWYWWLRGYRAECGELVAAVLELPGLPEDQTTALALALGSYGSFGGKRDFDEVMGWARRARDICDAEREPLRHPLLRMLGPFTDMFEQGFQPSALDRLVPMFDDADAWLRAFAHLMHGQIDLNVGRAADAETHFGLALDGFRALGERWGRSFAMMAQAEIITWRGEHRRAAELFEESRRLLAELGTSEDAPPAYIRLAAQLWLLGERDRAREMITDALRIAERTGAPEGLAFVHLQLGEFARLEGRCAEARRRLERALALAHEAAGPPHVRAIAASALGLLDAVEGDLAAAEARHTEALRDAVAVLDSPIIAHVLVGFADLALRRGEPARVAEVLGAAHGIRGMPDLSQPDLGRVEQAARAAPGADAFDAAYTRGRALTLDDVLTLLGVERPPPLTLWKKDDRA